MAATKKIYRNAVGQSKYTGLLLILPFIIGFMLFTLYPLLLSFLLGLNCFSEDNKAAVGINNYIQLILYDKEFHKAIVVTLKYTIMMVSIKLVVSMLAALLLNIQIKGIGVFRTLFYIPSILGSNLAIVILWRYLFTTNGLVNQVAELFGILPVGWYSGSDSAMWIIVLLRVWEFGSTMVIFLSALNNIPRELYDAAKVDGSGKVFTFFKITLPMMKNVIFLNLIIQTITALQEFNAPFLITGGGPMKSTYTISMMIYDEAFYNWNIGYANAISWMLFLIIAFVVSLMFMLTKKWRRDGESL